MLEIKKVNEVPLPKTFLFYGKSGTGKTTLAGTFPKPLFLDINENGTASVDNKEASVISIKTYDEFNEFIMNIDEYYEKLKWETLVIDTIGKLQELNLNFLAKGGKILINHYGDSTNEMQQVILKLISHSVKNDYYLVFTAHERDNTESDEETGEVLNPSVMAQLTPKLSEWLHATTSIAGHTRIFEKKNDLGQSQGIFYCIKIGADPVFKTKVRVPKEKMVANIIANPTCDKLMSVLDGTYKEKYLMKKEGKK